MKLTDYIKGNRRGEEAHGIELDSMRDPLLGEALDGFDTVPDDHQAALNRLSERIRESAAGGKAATRSRAADIRERRIRGWSVAAAAVLLVGMVGGGAWLLHEGIPSSDSTLARKTGHNEYYSDEIVTILPPVTVVKEDTVRDSTRTKEREERVLAEVIRVPNNPAPATDISTVQFDDETVVAAVTQKSTVQIRGASIASRQEQQDNVAAQPPDYEVINAENAEKESVAMRGDSALQAQVVIVGRGTQRRYFATGSVSAAEDSSRSEDNEYPLPEPAADTVVTAEFYEFIAANRLPRRVEGRAKVAFDVSSKGRPRNIKTIESSSPAAARAAKRVLRQGPDWPAEPSRKLIIINL